MKDYDTLLQSVSSIAKELQGLQALALSQYPERKGIRSVQK